MRRLLVAGLALGLVGCVNLELATIPLVSADRTTPRERLSESTTGQNCSDGFTAARFELAVQEAVSKVPGANGLADVKLSIDRKCYIVEGEAVRLLGN